jgi:hypothetical protein
MSATFKIKKKTIFLLVEITWSITFSNLQKVAFWITQLWEMAMYFKSLLAKFSLKSTPHLAINQFLHYHDWITLISLFHGGKIIKRNPLFSSQRKYFFANHFQKWKMFLILTTLKNTRSQFHQHITCSFCTDIFAPTKYKP